MKRGSLIIIDLVFVLSIILFISRSTAVLNIQTICAAAAVVLMSAGSLMMHYTYYRLTKKIY